MEWAPIGATWYYDVIYPYSSVVECLALKVVKDTTINDIPARFIEGKLYKHSGDTIPATEVYDQGNIILHQKGDSVYYLRENKFELLYDFSMEVGDTMEIVTPAPHDPNYVADTMIQIIVVSVGTEVVGNCRATISFRNALPIWAIPNGIFCLEVFIRLSKLTKIP